MRVFLMFSAVLLAAMPAMATDEFGARFADTVPSALSDQEEGLGAILGLEPAAGEEEAEREEQTTEDAVGGSEAEADADQEAQEDGAE
jgi:hypothetical protein